MLALGDAELAPTDKAEDEERVAEATVATLDDLGSATFAADLASLLHETLNTRLFRS